MSGPGSRAKPAENKRQSQPARRWPSRDWLQKRASGSHRRFILAPVAQDQVRRHVRRRLTAAIDRRRLTATSTRHRTATSRAQRASTGGPARSGAPSDPPAAGRKTRRAPAGLCLHPKGHRAPLFFWHYHRFLWQDVIGAPLSIWVLSRGPPGVLLGLLEASWGGLGPSWDGLGGPLGAVLGPLGPFCW